MTKKEPRSLAQEQLEMELELESQGEPIESTSPRPEQQPSSYARVKSDQNVRPHRTEGECWDDSGAAWNTSGVALLNKTEFCVERVSIFEIVVENPHNTCIQ